MSELILKWYWRYHVLEVEEASSVAVAVATLSYAGEEGLSSPSHIEVVSSDGASRRIEGDELDDMIEAYRREQQADYQSRGLTRPIVAKVVIADGEREATIDWYQDGDKAQEEVSRLARMLGDRVRLVRL